MPRAASTRKGITKTVRFEVFKRDSFRCQYCGSEAPNVLLHVDHIKPVAAGGTNDLINLITACAACNAGKTDRALDDTSAVQKQRAQMEELQERREQLELLMQWREGLRDLDDQAVERLASYWNRLTPGRQVSELGKQKVKKWLRKFSLAELTEAMDAAATAYLEVDKEGNCTEGSWEKAWNKIAGICRVNQASKDDPDLRELYYIRGVLRNRIDNYYETGETMRLLKAARSWGVSTGELYDLARSTWRWNYFVEDVVAAMKEHGYTGS